MRLSLIPFASLSLFFPMENDADSEVRGHAVLCAEWVHRKYILAENNGCNCSQGLHLGPPAAHANAAAVMDCSF
jgi:hypothetical protein